MSEVGRIPDAIIGIDWGTDGTKAAAGFMSPTGQYRIGPLHLDPKHNTNIIPTALAYQATGRGLEIGMEAVKSLESSWHYFEHIKLPFLENPDGHISPKSGPHPLEKVLGRAAVGDFFRQLLPMVISAFNDSKGHNFPAWDSATIDILLTTPAVVNEEGRHALVGIVRQAGWQTEKHKVFDIHLKESDAAAVELLDAHYGLFKNGNNLLVADIGGGTSDLTFLRVADKDNWKFVNASIKPASSQKLGGSHIDNALAASIQKLLARAEALANENGQSVLKFGVSADQVARRVIRSDIYRSSKHQFSERGSNLLVSVPISHSLVEDISFSDDAIQGVSFQNKDLIITSVYLASLFREQVHGSHDTDNKRGIVGQIVDMRDDLFVSCLHRNQEPSDKASASADSHSYSDALQFLMFSGGMGASPYVQAAVKAELGRRDLPTALKLLGGVTQGVEYPVVTTPQMCVCQGLVRAWARGLEMSAKMEKKPDFADKMQHLMKFEVSWKWNSWRLGSRR